MYGPARVGGAGEVAALGDGVVKLSQAHGERLEQRMQSGEPVAKVSLGAREENFDVLNLELTSFLAQKIVS